MAHDLFAWHASAWQWLGLLLLSSAAAALALELARRAMRHRGAARSMWLGWGALALGSGLWSAHFIAASGAPGAAGYGEALLAATTLYSP
ncbi:MAG TPA: hypothetical protein VFR90_10060, partial [Methylibium sp.]|uniref:hypothetical protein n=1 Tax=Methylibium sp. TaxID=2067992 RepID=UPI002DB64F28